MEHKFLSSLFLFSLMATTIASSPTHAKMSCRDRFANIQQKMTTAEMEPISSPYLAGGISKDKFQIETADVQNNVIFAKVKMISYFSSKTDSGGFHLSVPVAVEIVSQVGIIHGHVLLGLKKKTGEVWMRDYEVIHRKPIRDPENIRVKLTLEESKTTNKDQHSMEMLFYSFDINDGAAKGKMRLYFENAAQIRPHISRLFD